MRIFGLLRPLCKERGQPANTAVDIDEVGVPAGDIALELGLPLERIEGVFVNHTVYGLEHVVRPGDQIAFVPYGTPGPHRFYLGLYKAGRGGPSASDEHADHAPGETAGPAPDE